MNTFKKIGKIGAAGALVGAIAAASLGIAASSAMAQSPTPQTPQTQQVQAGQRQRGPQGTQQNGALQGDPQGGRGGPGDRGGPRGGTVIPTTGTIKEYTINPMGDYDGFAFVDGTRVEMPPPDALKVKDLFSVGASVTVNGYQHPERPDKALGANAVAVAPATEIRAETLTGGSKSYTIEKPTTPPTLPAREVVTQTSTIASVSLNANGDLDGFTLADKTVVRTPPHESATLKDKLTVGASVEVVGDKHVGNSGLTVIRAESIKVNGTAVFTAPAHRGPGGPEGGRGHGGPGGEMPGERGGRGPGGRGAPQQNATPVAP